MILTINSEILILQQFTSQVESARRIAKNLFKENGPHDLNCTPAEKPSQFPAWWILGAQNNESPVQEENENVCWPLYGSGEIDIFEHHGDYTATEFTSGAIVSLDSCDKGDWWSARKNTETTLTEYHEYSVEWEDDDLVYRLDGNEIYRNIGMGATYSEPMFAILNYAKITDSDMTTPWTMEVDWVKHEKTKLIRTLL